MNKTFMLTSIPNVQILTLHLYQVNIWKLESQLAYWQESHSCLSCNYEVLELPIYLCCCLIVQIWLVDNRANVVGWLLSPMLDRQPSLLWLSTFLVILYRFDNIIRSVVTIFFFIENNKISLILHDTQNYGKNLKVH